MRFRYRVVAAAAVLSGCTRQEKAASDLGPHWYHASRIVALVDSSSRDSVALDAYGARLDSLAVVARFFVGPRVVFEESWNSGYELIEMDSLRADTVALARYLQHQFEQELASIEISPFDMNELRMFGDTNVLHKLGAVPARVVTFSYGYESTVTIAWDARRKRFELLWSCC